MSAAHDKDIASLSGFFGPPWTREALGEVLAHHDGDKMAAAATILAHRSAHPDRVLRALREGTAAAASFDRDGGGGESPPPPPSRSELVERVPAPPGGASRDEAELAARGGSRRRRRSEAASSPAEAAALLSEAEPGDPTTVPAATDDAAEAESPPEVEMVAATRRRPGSPPRRPWRAVRAVGAAGDQGFTVVATAEQVETSNDSPLSEATLPPSDEDVPCCSCNLPGCSCNLRLGGGNRMLQIAFVALAAVVIIIVGVLAAKGIFTPTPSSAEEQAETTVDRIVKLTASDLPAQSVFGADVAISGDTLVVGAGYWSGSGSVYVFTRTGATWTRQARLNYPGAAKEDRFGRAVAIYDDTIVTWGSIDTSSGGSAYVFARTGTSWTQQAELVAADEPLSSSRFGSAVSVSGGTAVIGDFGDDNYSGSAYVFTRTGTTWTQQAKLTATDAADGNWFGWSVAVSGDTAVVGTVFGDSAYVFERTGTTWTQQAKLEANDTVGDSGFGISVAVSGDTIVIGAHYDDEVKGSAYVFTRTSSGWIRQAKLTANDGADDDFFGVSVAVSGDKVVIGAYGTDEGTLEDAGSAYVFKRSGTAWSEVLKLKATDASEDDYFGGSVAALASAPSRHLLSWSAEMLLAPTPAG